MNNERDDTIKMLGLGNIDNMSLNIISIGLTHQFA